MNHIPQTIDKQELNSLFGQHGLCQVHLKSQVGNEEQHAFVNYTSLGAAQTAARVLNGTSVGGSKITVKLQSDRTSGREYTVKVENLSKIITEEALEDVFGFYGEVEVDSIKINTPANSPFGYAYVNYYSFEDAQRAVDELNDVKIAEGAAIKVKIHRSQSTPSPVSPTSVYSAHYESSPGMSHRPSFNNSMYGRPTVRTPGPPGPPIMHSSVLHPPVPSQQRSMPPPPCSSTVKVSMHGHLTAEDLEILFNQFGRITTKPTIIPGSPNFAYVNYSSPDEARAALAFNRQQIKGVMVYVKLKMDANKPWAMPVPSVSHDYVYIDCEPRIVQMVTSQAQLEYKLQLQGIESSLSVKILPGKNGAGFNISGKQESLEEAKSNLNVVIAKARDQMGEKSFTLPCHYIPVFTNQEAVKRMIKIEQKHNVDVLVYDSTSLKATHVSIFSQFVSTQLKRYSDSPATTDCVAKYLTSSPAQTTCKATKVHISGDVTWEWQDDDGSFKAYDAKQSKLFNQKFQSDPVCTFSTLIITRLGVTGYSINLKTMTQMNVSTRKSRQIRRQPVRSAPGEWFYTDDRGKLVPYTEQQSREIEAGWISGEKILSMIIDGRHYKLDLGHMKQTDSLTLHERKITRRSTPGGRLINFQICGLKENFDLALLDFKEELESYMVKSSVALPSNSEDSLHTSLCDLMTSYFVSSTISDTAIHVQGAQGYIDKVLIKIREEKLQFERKLLARRPAEASRTMPPPECWDHQDEEVVLKEVSPGGNEWATIERLVHASLPTAHIKKVERIQNVWLWEKYCFSKERMHGQNKGIVNEKQLFHGTRSTAPEKIFKSRQGFDFRFCSRGMWGIGTYFAVKAKYSDNYAYQSGNFKQLILAKVLTGETHRCNPDSSLKKPPVKNHSTETFVDELYDSVSGNTNDSDIFIIYDHEKAYPEYLITYDTAAQKFLF